MKHTFELPGQKGGALYGNSNQCYSLLNWKFKREDFFSPQHMFDGSVFPKEFCGKLIAV